jgi:D-tyrosyl-tRNA(Tyr) deacylase
MRVVLQRVSEARVRVDGRITGEIGPGLLLLCAFRENDTDAEMRWMADKLCDLRIFRDDEGKMNRSARDIGGGLLVVSQFTLYGDARKGRRPSFIGSAPGPVAERLYDRFVEILRGTGLPIETGEFAADMKVELVNDGPVTLTLDRDA